MADKNTRNPEPFEMTGSKDLRESFKERGRIRGSWFINGIELHQFEANSPASVVATINAHTGAHFVAAEIDDGGHLVLIDKSGAEIMVRAGAEYVATPPVSTGNTGADVVAAMRFEDDRKKADGDKGNDVLDMLGLEETDNAEGAVAAQPGFETGRSADERKQAREDELHQSQGGGYANRPASGPLGSLALKMPNQIASNPTPGNMGGSQGKLADGRGRTGTGGGQGEAAASTIQRTSQGGQEAPVPGA